MKKIVFLSFLIYSSNIHADILEDFDSLGRNKVLLEKAKALEPNKKIEIIQDRIINRKNRHEFYPGYEMVQAGGSPYFHSQMISMNYMYHISPYWSVGLNYGYAFNQLSTEGQNVIDYGKRKQNELLEEDPNSTDKADPFIPEMNWLKQSVMAQVDWYPIYGKFKLLNTAIVHFDIYTTLGVGKIELKNNDSNLYQFGLGMGFWWSQNLTSRLEAKYSSYVSEFFSSENRENIGSFAVYMGYML